MLHKALATTQTHPVASTKSGVRHYDTGYWKPPHPRLSTALFPYVPYFWLPSSCQMFLPTTTILDLQTPFFWVEIIACRFQEYLPLFDAILVPPSPWLQSC